MRDIFLFNLYELLHAPGDEDGNQLPFPSLLLMKTPPSVILEKLWVSLRITRKKKRATGLFGGNKKKDSFINHTISTNSKNTHYCYCQAQYHT